MWYPLCVLLKSRISSHFARNLARACETRRPYTTVNTPTAVKMHKDKSVTLLRATLDVRRVLARDELVSGCYLETLYIDIDKSELRQVVKVTKRN